jgi:hypothetical protein
MALLHDSFSDEITLFPCLAFCPGGERFQYIVKHDKLGEPIAAYLVE